MKKLCLLTIFLFAGIVGVNAQTGECPVDKVCITPTAARKALEDGDKVIALTKEIAVKDQAFADITKELNDMRGNFREVSGRNDELRQNAVADRAIMAILVANSRKKCQPLSICF